jgi:xanthocillin biosynthesis cytochrome P450 monooxygenase
MQSVIKRTIFRPLYFNFPVLDEYPHIFKSRTRAFEIVAEFGDLLYSTVNARPNKQAAEKKTLEEKQVVDLLDAALEKGLINDEQYRANIKITFLTAHEDVQQLLNSTFWELGKSLVRAEPDHSKCLYLARLIDSQNIQENLRREVLATGVTNPSADILNSLPYLSAVIYELLRLYPPVSQLINRVTTDRAVLGGRIALPKRTWVGWNTYGAHRDPAHWGPTARTFDPARWGSDVEKIKAKVRKDCVDGKYIPFNAYSRKCLGQGFALLQMKTVLFELVRRTKWVVHPSYKLRLTSVSYMAPHPYCAFTERFSQGGILSPLGCRVIFEEVLAN